MKKIKIKIAGRPGWHIEDTAIAEKYFGPQYDIHGGAKDLIFPHHEAEIAQMEAVSGKKPFVKIWLHTGFLLVKSKKMSKSLGNFITIRDFLKKYPPEILRFIILSSHYRSSIDYNESLAINAVNSIKTIKDFLEKLKLISSSPKPLFKKFKRANIKPQALSIKTNIKKYEELFNQAMEDDFNTPKALATIFNLISSLQDKIWRISPAQAKEVIRFLNKKLDIFGIKIKPLKIPQKIKRLAAQREKLRINKQFIQADALRKQIEELGYIIEDTTYEPKITASRH